MSELTWADLGEQFDGPHATPTRQTSGAYFLNISSLVNGRLDLTASDRISDVDFERWTRRVTPQEGDLLYSYETRLGEAALMPSGIKACLGRRMALLRPNRDVVDPKFLLYYYLSPEFQRTIRKHTITGATVPRLLLSEMPSWPVGVPGLSEQRGIAEVLGALDDRIAANANQRRVTADLMQASFDACGADRSVEQGSRLDELIEVNPSRPMPRDREAVYLEMRQLPQDEMTVAEWSHRPPRGGARFRNGDTLLARITPCLENGKTGFVDFLGDSEIGIGSTEYIVLRSRDQLPEALTYFLAKTPRFRDFAIKRMVGTSGRQRLSGSDLVDYPLGALDEHRVQAFAGLSDALLPRLKASVDEDRRLRAARDSLLPLLMSGKVRVKDAESAVGEVL